MLSIIIPTCNRKELLSNCLDQLIAALQHQDANLFEVIVTDDSTNKVTENYIKDKYPCVKWCEGPRLGPAANRNNGANHASGDWLIFIDDDCIPSAGLPQAYYTATIANKDVDVFEGHIGPDREKKSFDEESPLNESGGFLWSCNFMISSALFKELNGFDPKFAYAAMEDVDLRYRLLQKNKKIKFLPEASVIHPWRAQKKMISATNKRFQSVLFFLNKHPELRDEMNFFYFFRAFIHSIRLLIKCCFRFKFKGFGKQLAYSFMQLYFAFFIFFRFNKRPF